MVKNNFFLTTKVFSLKNNNKPTTNFLSHNENMETNKIENLSLRFKIEVGFEILSQVRGN